MKKTEKIDIRLIVEPAPPWSGWSENYEREQIMELETILYQIKRHVDGVGYTSITWDARDYCEFCLHDWEVDTDGEPVCCGTAVTEFNESW